MMGVLCLQDCKNIVIKLSKLNRAIDQQQHLVNSLEQSSITYHLEKDDLDSMIAARKRCLEIANRGSDRG
jgi:surface antigen